MTSVISTRELARHTRAIVDRLDSGETIVLTRRDQIVGHLIPAILAEHHVDVNVPPPSNPRGLRDWRPPVGPISTRGSDALAALRQEER